MRVLHVISGLDPQNGGPTTALIGMTRWQCEAGLKVCVLATWKWTTGLPVADEMRRRGIEVVHVGPARGRPSWHPDLPRAAQQAVGAADIVHIHAVWEAVQRVASRAARLAGVPYLFTPHGMLDPWNMSKRRWLKHLYLRLRMAGNINGASALHFATDAERDAVRRLGLRPPAIVEPFGLDLTEFTAPPAGTFRGKFPQLGDKPFVLFLGRLHAGKGLELLVPAFARCRLDPWMLVIAGPDTGLGPAVQADVARLGLANHVLFTGMLSGVEKSAALAEANLLALPSFHENFGLAAVEALASGTPVIVSDQVYLHSQITAAGVGACVPTRIEPLAEELRRWMSDASLRHAATSQARRFVAERFDARRIAQNWIEHYTRLRT